LIKLHINIINFVQNNIKKLNSNCISVINNSYMVVFSNQIKDNIFWEVDRNDNKKWIENEAPLINLIFFWKL
jgi:hypothetical protein